MSGTIRNFYTKQIAQLEERLAAISGDLESVQDSEKELTLNKQAKQTMEKIKKTEEELAQLDAGTLQQSSLGKQVEIPEIGRNIRENNLEKYLQKIDFLKAKETAGSIKERLNREGGAVLFFLQKSKKQMGRYCVEEMLNVIMGDQIIDGQVMGAYRRYSVDLDSAISQFNEIEFLIRLASYFNIEESSNLDLLSQRLREKIRSSIDNGTTIFLEIKSLDDLLEQAEFLDWFIQEFWKPLIDEVVAVSQKYKSKFIVALIADSHILPECPREYFCDDEAFDCYKMLELPLPNWSVEDIHDWLIRFRTLSSQIQETNADLKRVANKIHRDSEGTPQSVCANLRELFL